MYSATYLPDVPTARAELKAPPAETSQAQTVGRALMHSLAGHHPALLDAMLPQSRGAC